MANYHVRVFDLKTNSEITEGLDFRPINDREHYGRKFITHRVPKGSGYEDQNVGIMNPDGSVEAQPGYRITSEAAAE